ncbi:hypothetical protein BB558_002662 [Smittium angustum]|uniref:Chromo domain-containing protein n=1 Tax=Smittium angustum TaxID=133377 RepID=A0A2U1J848_SMIAN|nr:hypothetical protein BB558_002662 [Smittium angustum]
MQPVEANNEQAYRVFQVLDSKLKYDWERQTPSERSWEKVENLTCNKLLREFHLKNPEKPGKCPPQVENEEITPTAKRRRTKRT